MSITIAKESINNMKRNWKIVVLIAIIPCSWLLFSFFTYGEKSISTLIPIVILMVQLVVTLLSRKRKLLWLMLLNPVIFYAICYTGKPIINYAKGTPTKMHCSYHIRSTSLDSSQLVYMEYDDDDCDWDGLYCYSFDVNNFVTDGLISVFGNPIKSNFNNKSGDK